MIGQVYDHTHVEMPDFDAAGEEIDITETGKRKRYVSSVSQGDFDIIVLVSS